MPTPTETAIIVAVPEAEPAVGVHRARFDAAASWGVPAHVTILYPFLDPEAVTDEVVQLLRGVVGSAKAFACTFAETSWFDRDVLWLAPDPDAQFRALTSAVAEAFPSHQPYGGAFGADVIPHLTVAETRLAQSPEEVFAVERLLQPALPVHCQVAEALLVAGTTAPNSWRTVRFHPERRSRFSLSPRPFRGLKLSGLRII